MVKTSLPRNKKLSTRHPKPSTRRGGSRLVHGRSDAVTRTSAVTKSGPSPSAKKNRKIVNPQQPMGRDPGVSRLKLVGMKGAR